MASFESKEPIVKFLNAVLRLWRILRMRVCCLSTKKQASACCCLDREICVFSRGQTRMSWFSTLISCVIENTTPDGSINLSSVLAIDAGRKGCYSFISHWALDRKHAVCIVNCALVSIDERAPRPLFSDLIALHSFSSRQKRLTQHLYRAWTWSISESTSAIIFSLRKTSVTFFSLSLSSIDASHPCLSTSSNREIIDQKPVW